jgi:hypothetical protein
VCSASYDTSTFVFDGLISSTAFSSITLTSTSAAAGSFNVPEVLFGAAPASTVPEPLTASILGAGLAGLAFLRRRKMAKKA